MVRALLIEDDPAVADALAQGLRQHGWEVDHVSTGGSALATRVTSDIVLLDLNLPDMDGLEVCQLLRGTTDVPIIAVTSRSEELDKVLCLRLGADDYLVKPYGIQELLARMAAVRRRARAAPSAPPPSPPPAVTAPEPKGGGHLIDHGRLVVDQLERSVLLDGRAVQLTRKEFALLVLLAGAPRRVFTRDHVLESVWSHRWIGTSRTLDSHVASLRRKLGDPRWIRTARGVGFSFEALAPDADSAPGP